MTRADALHERYFQWMCGLVMGDQQYSRNLSYEKLMRHLDARAFIWIIPMDEYRARHGVDLRYDFGYENHYPDRTIEHLLDIRECSILEMMVALARTCEERIMEDDTVGNRTGQWFWNMIVSLGLGSMSDSRYNEREVDRILDIFLNRTYDANGRGGLFTIEDCPYDLRAVDIWYQMMWYLNTIL